MKYSCLALSKVNFIVAGAISQEIKLVLICPLKGKAPRNFGKVLKAKKTAFRHNPKKTCVAPN